MTMHVPNGSYNFSANSTGYSTVTGALPEPGGPSHIPINFTKPASVAFPLDGLYVLITGSAAAVVAVTGLMWIRRKRRQ